MSKDFDTALSAALDRAAAAARTEGAAAAWTRGKRRTVRRRLAVSTLSTVLVVGGATAAFKIASPHGGTPRPTATGPLVAASVSVYPSPGPSTGPSTSRNAVATPHQVAAGAWLSAAELPFAGTFAWKAEQADPHGVSPIGQPLTATVFYVANNTTFQSLTTCADPTSLLGRTTGAQHIEYTATTPGSSDTASQFVFFFTDPASAQQTFTWLQSQYSPTCAAESGMTTTMSAGDGQTSVAWFSVKGASGAIDAPSYTREYFVLRDSVIAYVLVSSSTGSLPMTQIGDAAQLSIIAAHLCVYGGLCT